MRNNSFLILSLLVVMALASCTSYKKVPYLQNSQDFKSSEQSAKIQEPRIQPNDLLTITVVSSQDQQAAMAFNLIVPSVNTGSNASSQSGLQHYIVDVNGCVIIPNVGKVHLAGLTASEAEALVLEKVKGAFNEVPTVIVRFVDYSISVLGEVASPGTYAVKNGRVNVLQALSLAGDLTIYGMRDNVKIIRENENGVKNIYEVNLNDVSLLDSPYYNLQQNDIVYVTPNKVKAKNSEIGSSTSMWISGTSIAISLTSLLYNILKYENK